MLRQQARSSKTYSVSCPSLPCKAAVARLLAVPSRGDERRRTRGSVPRSVPTVENPAALARGFATTRVVESVVSGAAGADPFRSLSRRESVIFRLCIGARAPPVQTGVVVGRCGRGRREGRGHGALQP